MIKRKYCAKVHDGRRGGCFPARRDLDRHPARGWFLRIALAGILASALVSAPSLAYGVKTPTPTIPVSGASATVTVQDGLTASGVSVPPFRAQFTIAGISFPNHEGADQALPGNVFVHIALKVTNLASATRLISFNGDNFRTMAIGANHDIPALGVADDACNPPPLDGLTDNQQVAQQVATQWCVLSSTTEAAVVRPHKSKVVTFGGQVVSQTDGIAANFALIYCPSGAATPTILPVGPGGTPTTVPS
jgi:hypothetical protein